ncbi:hypothetical protein ABZW30_46130 [Kitasatospora sp. NPDC004669]
MAKADEGGDSGHSSLDLPNQGARVVAEIIERTEGLTRAEILAK